MAAIGRETLNGGDFLARDAGDRGDAGARRFAVDVHGTGAAERHATPELRAGHVQRVAQNPEQRHVRADIDGFCGAVQGETDGHGVPPLADVYPTTTPCVDENPQKPAQVWRGSTVEDFRKTRRRTIEDMDTAPRESDARPAGARASSISLDGGGL